MKKKPSNLVMVLLFAFIPTELLLHVKKPSNREPKSVRTRLKNPKTRTKNKKEPNFKNPTIENQKSTGPN